MQKIKRAARAARTLELKNNYAENEKLWEKKKQWNFHICSFDCDDKVSIQQLIFNSLCLLQRRSSEF